MAESAPARGTGSKHITIVYANGTYTSAPTDADVPNDGTVNFESKNRPCWVYYTPSDAFVEETGGIIELDEGPNGPFTPSRPNFRILYCVTDPNNKCTPRSPKGTGGYTIKVGSGVDEGTK